jgi:sulfide:quinone oxidoreductase
MKMKKLSAHFYVAEQFTTIDIEAASVHGIKTVINNRPDDEAEGQPKSADLEKAAKDLGLHFVHIPISAKAITDQNIDDFHSTCREVQGPILAFCRTGQRSTILWALGEVKVSPVETVLAVASEAGYDLSRVRERLTIHSNPGKRSVRNR